MDSSPAAAPKGPALVTPRVPALIVTADALETPSTAGEFVEPPPSAVLLPEAGPHHQFGSMPSMPISFNGDQVGLPTPLPLIAPLFTSPGQFNLAAISQFAKELAKPPVDPVAPSAPVVASFMPPLIGEGSLGTDACVAALVPTACPTSDGQKVETAADAGRADVTDSQEVEKELGSSTRFESIAPLSGDLAAGVAATVYNSDNLLARDLRSAADATIAEGAIAGGPTKETSKASLSLEQPDTTSAFQRGASLLALEKGELDAVSAKAMGKDVPSSGIQAAEAHERSRGAGPVNTGNAGGDAQALNEAYLRLVKPHGSPPRRPVSPKRPKTPRVGAGPQATSKNAPPKPGPSKSSQAPRVASRGSGRATSRGRGAQRPGPN